MNSNAGDEKTFLSRLTSIVEANLSDENFGVSELAQKIGISRSQLYKRINSLTRKSASQFVREVRLNKALELLRQTELHVSEVSYKVGFNSPTYFNKCFHEQFGYPPGETKSHIQTDAEPNEQTNEKNIVEHKASKQLLKWMVAVISIIILFGAFLLYQTFSGDLFQNDPEISSKSIAVLPLKNLSNNPDIQYLADGIMEDILFRLSYVDGLVVKSRISAEKIGGEKLTANEIAKEMNVGYFLEGSIMPENEKIRINVQLISATEDKYVWAYHFDKDLTEILPFITEVSRQITEQLEIILSPAEEEQVEKNYTENKEAYLLYLKGRFFLNRRTKDEVKNSIDYFNQALKMDPNYSLAWAGLGDSYFIMTRYDYMPESEGKLRSLEYATKSLKIDSSLAESHAVLGAIALILERNWKEAERELNLALELNPNLDLAHIYYGHYLRNRGKFEEAIKHYSIAIDLDPNVLTPYDSRAYCLYQMGKFNKSLVDWEKVKEINKFYGSAYKITFLIYVRQGEDLKAIEELKTIISIFYPEVKTEYLLEEIYAKSGMEGVIRWYIKLRIENGETNGIDRLYAVIGDWENALLNLEKTPWHFDYGLIKYGIEYKPIHNDPRFIALINKMRMDDL